MDSRQIGKLIRIARKMAGLSQMALAERIGISYQQVQKYENGKSEISVLRLSQIARALNAPINRFIADEKMTVAESTGMYGALSDEDIELLKSFRSIKNRKLKDALLLTMKSMASEKKQTKRKPKASAS